VHEIPWAGGNPTTGRSLRGQFLPRVARFKARFGTEDVLEVYTRPYNPLRPQICMDEPSKGRRDEEGGKIEWRFSTDDEHFRGNSVLDESRVRALG
jgi:hypothetical protein